MAGTLTISITEPDARAMRALGYRLMWIVTLDGRTLGWGHGHRLASVELDAFEFAVEEVDADQVTDIAVLWH
jgi:hypothetical protein